MLTDLAGPRFGGCVTSQCLTIETHSQTGTVRHGDDPLLVGRDRPVEQLGSHGVLVLVELEQVRVGYGGDEVEVCRQAHRGGEHVRHAGQAGSHGQRRDPPASGYAPRPDDVGLHDVYCSIGYEVPEACQPRPSLVAGYGYVDCLRKRRTAFTVVGWNRFLEPVDAEALELASGLERRGLRPGVVGVYHQMHVVTDRLPHRADAPQVLGKRYRGKLGGVHVHQRVPRGVGGASDLDLHVPETRLDVPPRLVCQPLGVLTLCVESGAGVGLDVVTVAAEHSEKGKAGLPSHKVPYRDVKAGDGRWEHAPITVLVGATHHHLPQPLGSGRVLPQNARNQFVMDHGFHYRGRASVDGGLPDTDVSVVGTHLHQEGRPDRHIVDGIGQWSIKRVLNLISLDIRNLGHGILAFSAAMLSSSLEVFSMWIWDANNHAIPFCLAFLFFERLSRSSIVATDGLRTASRCQHHRQGRPSLVPGTGSEEPQSGYPRFFSHAICVARDFRRSESLALLATASV